MSTKVITVTGHVKSKGQFVVQTENFKVPIGANESNPLLNAPSPIEYLLAGYAGCINAIGVVVAKEQNLVLEALTVQVEGTLNTDKFLGNPTANRAGFNQIKVTVHPTSSATQNELQKWLNTLEERCPVGDNLKYETPVQLQLAAPVAYATVV